MIHGNGDWGVGNGNITHNVLRIEPCLPACQPACGQMRVDFPKRHMLRTNEIVNHLSFSYFKYGGIPLASIYQQPRYVGRKDCSAKVYRRGLPNSVLRHRSPVPNGGPNGRASEEIPQSVVLLVLAFVSSSLVSAKLSSALPVPPFLPSPASDQEGC